VPRNGTRALGRASGSVSQRGVAPGALTEMPRQSLRKDVSIPVKLTPLKPETDKQP
jgi:hypothetical protein